MNIPLVDLTAQYNSIKSEIDLVIERTLATGNFTGGEEVASFEKEFATYIGSKYCVGLNSGTDALILGFRALGLAAGDEVIVPGNTFIATALGASENGLKPVFVDIDEEDFGINLDDLRKKITSRTRAIVLVHLYGQPDKIYEVQKIIKESRRKIYLVEDACQAHGSYYGRKRVGTFGIFSTFSFYPGKNLGAYGDGGAVVTNSSVLEKKIRLLKSCGQNKKYHYIQEGVNSRLDALQAAILRVKLKHLDSWNALRQQRAQHYTELLNAAVPSIITPREFADRRTVYHLYVIRVKNRNRVLAHLQNQNIFAQVHYPHPLHLQKVYAFLKYKTGSLPNTEKIAREVISLPMYPELSVDAISYIVKALRSYRSA